MRYGSLLIMKTRTRMLTTRRTLATTRTRTRTRTLADYYTPFLSMNILNVSLKLMNDHSFSVYIRKLTYHPTEGKVIHNVSCHAMLHDRPFRLCSKLIASRSM